jgi:hypothetical protein
VGGRAEVGGEQYRVGGRAEVGGEQYRVGGRAEVGGEQYRVGGRAEVGGEQYRVGGRFMYLVESPYHRTKLARAANENVIPSEHVIEHCLAPVIEVRLCMAVVPC